MIVLSYYGDDMLILYLNLSVNDTYISILYVQGLLIVLTFSDEPKMRAKSLFNDFGGS